MEPASKLPVFRPIATDVDAFVRAHGPAQPVFARAEIVVDPAFAMVDENRLVANSTVILPNQNSPATPSSFVIR